MSSTRYVSSLVVLVLMTCQSIEGWPTGAPTTVCGTMTPGHGTEQTMANPFTIDVGSATNYASGTKITVTIQGGAFKGTLIQARRKGSSNMEPVGTFEVPDVSTNLRLLQCTVAGDSITHDNDNDKTEVSVMWNPPDSDVGEVEFVATVAQAKTVWWKGAKSSALTASGGPVDPVTMGDSTMSEPASPTTPPTTAGDEKPNTASSLTQQIGQLLLFTVCLLIVQRQ